VSTRAFPKEATLFGDRLFVQYTPQAAHAYLAKVTKIGALAAGESQSDAARDLEVLPYVLLRRSYMHPFDLRREISRSTNAKNEFRFPPRALFNVQQYRNEVYYQVAVECVLAGEKMLDFAEDPNRAQLLYDALYFPIRTRKLPDEFEASRENLKTHLIGRMGNGNGDLLSREDLDILHAALRELIRFLCEPRTLLETMQSLAVAKHLPEPKVFSQGVIGVIDAAAGPKPPPAGSPSPGAAAPGDPTASGNTSAGAAAETGSSDPLSAAAPPAPQPDFSPQPAPRGEPATLPQARDGASSSAAASPITSPTPIPSSGASVSIASAASAEAQLPAAPPSVPPPLAPPGKSAPLLTAASEDRYRWQFDRYGYPLTEPAPIDTKGITAEPEAELDGTKLTGSAEVAALLNEFDEATKWLAAKHWTAIDIERWERMRLILTPPTWSYLEEAAGALRNPTSLPATKADEYVKALLGYRSNLQSALNAIWSAVAVAAMMSVHARTSSPAAHEQISLDMLGQVLEATAAREQMLEQLEQIAASAKSGVPFDARGNQSYLAMLSAVEESADRVRRQPPKIATEVAHQTAPFYENWFVEFYLGRSPQINSLWPFLAWAMGIRPLGLRNINPLRMTIREWTEANLEAQDVRQKAISLERLGFRREAESEGLQVQSDELIGAMLQSIRKRGYEKARVILQPSRDSLTWNWLPSENIACRIKMPDAAVPPVENLKYALVEVDDATTIDRITSQLGNLPPATRVALFAWASPPPNRRFPYPYIDAPQNLDDLVEQLDGRPASDWDLKLSPQHLS
jgi:hypothetical protein